MRSPLVISIAAGVCVGALAWIDPLFVPLVLAGPPISGALAALKGVAFRWVATCWALAGVSMIASDWIVNNEDKLFHVVLTAVMVGLSAIGWGTVRLLRRRSLGVHA